MINKDKSILNILNKLKYLLDSNVIEIKDYWDSDLSAIGLKNGNRLIYICSYNSKNDDNPSYYYELELLNDLEKDNYIVLEEGNDIPEMEMIKKIKNLLKIK